MSEMLTRDSPADVDGAKLPVGPRITPAEVGQTGRQLDVLKLMMQGKSKKAICRVFDLTDPTVKYHITQFSRRTAVL